MKTFDQICRKIDWSDMAKARVTVKNLAAKKPQLKPLADFLDLLAESAVEAHGIHLSTVYPNLIKARLIASTIKNKN